MTDCRHGLDPEACAMCSPGENMGPTQAGPLGGVPRTQAKYAGTCYACGETIVVGDALVRVDGAWIHEGCW